VGEDYFNKIDLNQSEIILYNNILFGYINKELSKQ